MVLFFQSEKASTQTLTYPSKFCDPENSFKNLFWTRHAMAPFVWAIMIIALTSRETFFVHGDIGSATSYGPPYIPTRCGGNREDQFPPGNLFVAVSDGLWDNGAACGRRYRVRCLSGPNRPCRHKTIEVKVVDFCPITPCPSTIVLSKESFAAVARQHARKINVEYIQYVPSPSLQFGTLNSNNSDEDEQSTTSMFSKSRSHVLHFLVSAHDDSWL